MKLCLPMPGDTYYIEDEKTFKKLVDTGNFIWIKTYYTSKQWWEFWKRKKIIGYEIMYIKDLAPWCNGSTQDFDSYDVGSIPAGAAKFDSLNKARIAH